MEGGRECELGMIMMLFLLISLGVAWLIDYYELRRVWQSICYKLMRSQDLGGHEEEDYLTHQGSARGEDARVGKAKGVLVFLIASLIVGLVYLVRGEGNHEYSGD